MQEIAPHVSIETSYAGVTLGAVSWPHGLILIDSPFRPDDIRSWRSSLLNLGGGVDRLLVNLDAHFDRTLGARGMDCTVVGHESLAASFRNRPVTFKPQGSETGSEWELVDNLGNIRWAPPEITFSNQLIIHWNDQPMLLEYHPGPAQGSIWAFLPEEAIIFLGDAITLNQPPFLAGADLPLWIESLQTLLAPAYRHYYLVSGRGGLVQPEQVRSQIKFLEKVQKSLESLASRQARPEDTGKLVKGLLDGFDMPADKTALYTRRLQYGLQHYYNRVHQRLLENASQG